MPETDPAKLQAAKAAAALVNPGMVVGLGSGTTASVVIRQLGDRVRFEGLRFTGVPTSEASRALAQSLGIALCDIDELDSLDLDIDGADEVDPQFRMIKGRGGALLREKVVAQAAKRRAIVVSPQKRVERLGKSMPVPLEVSPFGLRHTDRYLREMGAQTSLRRRDDGSPVVTDGGHRIIDCHFGEIADPAALNSRLRQVVGVFETGLFVDLCDVLIVGHADRAELFERPAG